MEDNINIKQAYQWGVAAREVNPTRIDQVNTAGLVAQIPDGMKLVDLKEFLPDHPKCKLEEREFLDLESFCGYVNEQKSEFSRIFANLRKPPYVFDAIIDYHGTGASPANWCGHHAKLTLALSDEFATWYKINGEMMTQSGFAEFLKDNRLAIRQPDNGEICTMVMALEATSEQRTVGKLPTNAGMQFSFSDEVKTSVGGNSVTVPNEITLNMPIFEGMGNEEIRAELKFKVKDGMLYFGIRMLAVERMLRLAVMAARERIRDKVSLPVYL